MNKHLSAIRKAGFGSLFTPTKAIRRVRAIAADRTLASLTGGCSGPGIFRIYTEFCSAEGEPGRLGQPGRATSAPEWPHCMVINLASGKVYPGVKSIKQRLKDVESACGQIASLWPGITK
jgi:hypothetical protein